MKKISVTKEYTLLDVEDIEKAVSEKCGRRIPISEIGCRIEDYFPFRSSFPTGMGITVVIHGEDGRVESYDDIDLFNYDWDDDEYKINGELCSKTFMNEAFIDPSLVFNFDVNMFKSFSRFLDDSD